MWQEEFIRKLVYLVSQNNLWNRIIALDLETDVRGGNFLSNERILAIGVAFFNNNGEIETKIFKLKDETDSSELDMLQQFDIFLGEKRPLGVTGYFFRQYDIPLLAIKRSYYRMVSNYYFSVNLWINRLIFNNFICS